MVSGILSGPVHAQIDVDFGTSDPGVRKAIPNWGLDTNWAGVDNMERGLGFLGTENGTLATNSGWPRNAQITAASKRLSVHSH